MLAPDLHWKSLEPRSAVLPRDPGIRSSFYLTMRDGVRVALDVHLPSHRQRGERIPTILRQTRYFRSIELRRPLDRPSLRDLFELVAPTRERFLARGYAWVDVDVRGSGVSSGVWPVPWSPAEVRDGAEIVDHIVAQPWSNGLVGATGISYDGTTADMLLVNRHPAVRAIIPRFSLFDAYEDVTFPGGVHLAWFTEGWSRFNRMLDDHRFHDAIAGLLVVIARAAAHDPAHAWGRGALALFERIGVERGSAALGAALAALVRGGRRVDADALGLLRARALSEHEGNGDVHILCKSARFRDDEIDPKLPGITVDLLSPRGNLSAMQESGAAIYSYGGWLDGPYANSAIKRFMNIPTKGRRLLLGPWGHGGAFAHRPFAPTRSASFDHDFEMLRFFDLHLKGIDDGIGDEPPVRYYSFGDNRWKTASTWPIPGARIKSLFLHPERRLLEDPSRGEGADPCELDRAMGTGERSRFRGLLATFVPADYPDLGKRHKSALHYDTGPLDADIEVTGHPIAHLFLRTNEKEADVFVYLEDIAPDGRTQYVTEGQLRASHRRVVEPEDGLVCATPYHSFRRAQASPLEPGSPALLTIALLPTSYRFVRGHRMRLVVTGADVDHFAPPPEGLSGFEILRSKAHPSRLELPVIEP